MRNRDLNMAQFQISKFAFRELVCFCRQYDEKRRKAYELRQLAAINCDGMPHTSTIGNPTEHRALVAAQFQSDCDMIEQAATLAAPCNCYDQLMKNVTLGMPYHKLNVPCGKNQFTDMRKHFFFLLARKKGLV